MMSPVSQQCLALLFIETIGNGSDYSGKPMSCIAKFLSKFEQKLKKRTTGVEKIPNIRVTRL